jgi:hypothetical protein
MNDPNRIDAGLNAFAEIILQQFWHLPGLEGVKIQNVFDGQLDRFHAVYPLIYHNYPPATHINERLKA